MTHDEVHVWFASLCRPPDELSRYRGLLSDDEALRAERMGHPQVRARFIVGRGLLRQVLADHLGCAPAELRFGYGAHGKPYLLGDEHCRAHFNVSHSGDTAVLTVTGAGAVGVDVEQIRPDRATDELARRFFADGEWRALSALPAAQRVPAFFRCWSRKEAFIKAIGDGLTFPLDAFEVSLRPDEPALLRTVHADPVAARRWTLHDLPAPRGYAAALAIEGTARIVIRQRG